MNYSLEEYKKLRKKEVDYFLRGINFENMRKKDAKIIDYPNCDCSNFFNNVGPNRLITEEFLTRVEEHYSNFVYTDLEFASSKDEVDTAIRVFVDKIRKDLDEYKYTMIKQTFIDKSKIKGKYITIDSHKEYNVKEDNLINMGLNFIKVQIGDKVFSAPKTGTESEEEDVTLNELNIMIVYVYILLEMINDKINKRGMLIDLNREKFEVTDSRYYEMYSEINTNDFNQKNYNKFIATYNQIEEQILSGETMQTMLNNLYEMAHENSATTEYQEFLGEAIKCKDNYEAVKAIYDEMKKFSKENGITFEIATKPKARG